MGRTPPAWRRVSVGDGWRGVLKGRAEICKTGKERGVVCFLRIEGVLLSVYVGVVRGERCEWESSVCAVGVVALGVVFVEVFYFWLGRWRGGGDEEVWNCSSFDSVDMHPIVSSALDSYSRAKAVSALFSGA